MTTESLPEAELEVLTTLWKLGESTVRDVREAMGQRRPMTHGAVSTLIRRLEDKGLVARRKGSVGKAYLFRAKVAAGSVHGRLIGRLLDVAFRGDSIALVSSLLETKPPTDAEIDTLQDLLEDLRQPKKRKAKSRRRRS